MRECREEQKITQQSAKEVGVSPDVAHNLQKLGWCVAHTYISQKYAGVWTEEKLNIQLNSVILCLGCMIVNVLV